MGVLLIEGMDFGLIVVDNDTADASKRPGAVETIWVSIGWAKCQHQDLGF